MQTIGIIGAMEEEVQYLKDKLDIISTKSIIGLDFFMGKMFGNNVVIVRSGIGKVNAAICTQVLVDFYAVDYIINIGVAGAISTNLKIRDTVISTDAIHHDFDTTVFGHKLGVIPRMDESCFKADKYLVELATQATENQNIQNVFTGTIVSGDQFITDVQKKNKIKEEFNPLCVEMEGAAIAQACYLNKIPFVIIRTISDNADEGKQDNYQTFFKESAKIASNIVQNMIQNMK